MEEDLQEQITIVTNTLYTSQQQLSAERRKYNRLDEKIIKRGNLRLLLCKVKMKVYSMLYLSVMYIFISKIDIVYLFT